MEKEQLGIYIHIPFCACKCNYCDFLSCKSDYDTMNRYVDALINEIRIESGYINNKNIRTIFIGGGTPSILQTKLMEKILKAINEFFNLDNLLEFTIECNPGTLTKEKLELYKQYNINRLSIGLQSANDNELKMLGRIHSFDKFLESYNLARECGFFNINIDIMSALPYQTLESYEDTLNKVLALSPEHISAYSLIVEEGTNMEKMVKNAKENILPDEKTEREMYYNTKRILSEKGYYRYEISNYAKKGKESLHNLSYWERIPYIGLGLGASSYIDNTRYNNTTEFEQYFSILENAKEIKDLEALHEDKTTLSISEKQEEFMFLGLRKMCGVSKKAFFEEFGKDIEEVYGKILSKHQKENLIEIDGDTIRLTELGIDVSNYVLSDYIF